MLNSKTIDALRPDPDKRLELAAGGVEGLVLRVTTGGAKTWMLRYRVDGQRRKLTIGRYPAVGVADARKLSLQALGKVASGEDPVALREERRKNAMNARVDTLKQLSVEYFQATAASKKPKTVEYEKWLWGKHVEPRIGNARLIELRRPDIDAFVRKVGVAAGPRTANYAHALVRQMINHAIRQEKLEFNPASIPKIFATATRERVLNENELRRLWATLEAGLTSSKIPVSPGIILAIKLCTLTLQRAGEIAAIRGSEIDWRERIWILPGDRSKNGRTHVVPLSDPALSVLREAIRLALVDFRGADLGPSGTAVSHLKQKLRDGKIPAATAVGEKIIESYAGPIFPSWTKPGKSIERHALTRGMKHALEKAGIENASTHDLRRTGASFMASSRCGVLTEIISRVLNHTTTGTPVTMIYNRYDYAKEKREALEKWSVALAEIVAHGPTSSSAIKAKVVQEKSALVDAFE